MTGKLGRNRDIALTTLIDLLVQVIFVFTLILISAGAIEGDPKERGWVTPEAWKTLISIFDIDPAKIRDTSAQIREIKSKYEKVRADLQTCEAMLDESQRKLAACEKQTGKGPGNPPCRDSAGAEMLVLGAAIDQDGDITVTLRPQSGELQQQRPLSSGALGTPLSVKQFGSLFLSWRQYGLARHPACAYKAEARYDPRAPAGKYEPARRAIANYFSLLGPPTPVP